MRYGFHLSTDQLYSALGSVDLVSKQLRGKASKVKIQRVLLTEGLWSSRSSKAIGALYSQGKTSQEIADALGISVKGVQAYLSYSKGEYNARDTASIRANKAYYERRKRVARAQVNHVKSEASTVEEKKMFWPPEKLYRLRLELCMRITPEEEAILHRFGKMREAIYRDIVVPEGITLHALHYAIQRAFGWQNSHLHCYTIEPMAEFARLKTLTDDRFVNWVRLCGIYFRFPSPADEDYSDVYWDDDYDGTQGFRAWLRKKYTGPFHYKGKGEHYIVAHTKASYFCEENRLLRVGPSFQEYMAGQRDSRMVRIQDLTVEEAARLFEGGLGELLERLRVDEVLSITGHVGDDPYAIADSAEANLPETMELYSEIQASYQEAVDQRKVLPEFQEAEANKALARLGAKTNPWTIPLTNALYYSYDYGDGWSVRITPMGVYTMKNSWTRSEEAGAPLISGPIEDKQLFHDYTVQDGQGNDITGPERDLIVQSGMKHTAKCLAADGLPLMDDVGGIHGFCDFLKTIRTGDPEEQKQSLEWARGMGWNGRTAKIVNIL